MPGSRAGSGSSSATRDLARALGAASARREPVLDDRSLELLRRLGYVE
jgi:hypothetical protein